MWAPHGLPDMTMELGSQGSSCGLIFGLLERTLHQLASGGILRKLPHATEERLITLELLLLVQLEGHFSLPPISFLARLRSLFLLR
mmetsp:Transcript_33564/g.78047  ORF Transcript_33564/g.78047 Transcript_33564/m.78047 type:complete len:86 (+) Transcript_33564:684-941(+)